MIQHKVMYETSSSSLGSSLYPGPMEFWMSIISLIITQYGVTPPITLQEKQTRYFLRYLVCFYCNVIGGVETMIVFLRKVLDIVDYFTHQISKFLD